MLAEEITGYLGCEKRDPAGRESGNSRNGTTQKTVLPEDGAVDPAVPRDLLGSSSRGLSARGWTAVYGAVFIDAHPRLGDQGRELRP